RHGCFRERCRPALAHRDPERCADRDCQGWDPRHERDRTDVPLPERRRGRRPAQGRGRREEGSGEEMNLIPDTGMALGAIRFPRSAFSAAIALAFAATLAGCGGEQHSDLRAELDRMTKDVRGKVDPLPTVTPYKPVPYEAEKEIDPFR